MNRHKTQEKELFIFFNLHSKLLKQVFHNQQQYFSTSNNLQLNPY